MRTCITLAAVALLGLLAGKASACDYNRAAGAVILQTVPTYGAQALAVPSYGFGAVAVPVYPHVGSFAVVKQRVFVQADYGFRGNGYGGFRGNGFRGNNVRGQNNDGSGAVGILRATGRTVGNVFGALVGN
jgi:hypothetical protein